MKQLYKICDSEAIRLATRDNLTLHTAGECGYRVVKISEAQEIVDNKSGLVYCLVTPTGWNKPDTEGYTVDAYFRGALEGYLGPDCDGIEPTWEDAREN